MSNVVTGCLILDAGEDANEDDEEWEEDLSFEEEAFAADEARVLAATMTERLDALYAKSNGGNVRAEAVVCRDRLQCGMKRTSEEV